jgi:hypothetical protein
MRPDLGRLGPAAEILQVITKLLALGAAISAVVYPVEIQGSIEGSIR